MSDKIGKNEVTSPVSDLANFTFGTNWADGGSVSQSKGITKPSPTVSGKESRPKKKSMDSSGEKEYSKQRRFRGKEFKKGGGNSSERDSFKPVVKASFYPEEVPFVALLRAMCESYKTYQLFDIAKLILLKEKLFVIAVEGYQKEGEPPSLLYRSQIDGLPFLEESGAIAHVISRFITNFFDIEPVQVDPPKGNFQVVNRSKISGKIIGSPNFHRYPQLLEQHYLSDGGKVSFETFEQEIEAVRDPATIQEWLETMKVGKKYTLKSDFIRDLPENFHTNIQSTLNSEASVSDSVENAKVEANVSPNEDAENDNTILKKEPLPTFYLLEEAQQYLLSHHKNRIVTAKKSIRFSGKHLKDLPEGSLKQSILSNWNLQNRFPLDTANNIRGRLRREGFNVFKKGSQGISYACIVRRRFIEKGQIFAESIQQLVDFIGQNQGCNRKELPEKLLGLKSNDPKVEISENNSETIDEYNNKLQYFQQMIRDLKWLLSEGYVTEYENGDLFLSVSSSDSYSNHQKT